MSKWIPKLQGAGEAKKKQGEENNTVRPKARRDPMPHSDDADCSPFSVQLCKSWAMEQALSRRIQSPRKEQVSYASRHLNLLKAHTFSTNTTKTRTQVSALYAQREMSDKPTEQLHPQTLRTTESKLNICFPLSQHVELALTFCARTISRGLLQRRIADSH